MIGFALTIASMGGMLIACLLLLHRRGKHGLLVLLPLLMAVGVYGVIGSPSLPDVPFASRGESVVAQQALAIAQQQQAEARFTAIKGLLADNPDDPNLLLLLAEAAASVGDFDSERAALEKRLTLIEASGETRDSTTRALLAEAMTRQAGGIVTDEALAHLIEALAIDGGDWRAAYLFGLHAEQNGRLREAVAIWQELGRRVAADETGGALLQLLNQKLSMAAQALNQPAHTLIIPPASN